MLSYVKSDYKKLYRILEFMEYQSSNCQKYFFKIGENKFHISNFEFQFFLIN